MVVEFGVTADACESFLAMIKENAQASVDEEPGCLQFDVLTEGPQTGRIVLYEVYSDEGSFHSHLATPHFRAFDAATREMVESKVVRSMRLHHSNLHTVASA